MTSFHGGPADKQNLMLRRSPHLLRVTEKDGKFDALDQLNDEPDPGETLYVYVADGKPKGSVHLNTGRKPGGGFFTIAGYNFYPDQPSQEILRNMGDWQRWCLEHAPQTSLP